MNKDELAHFGILGMKWGVRRFQNPDGTLTGAGRTRYGVGPASKQSTRNVGKTSNSSSGGTKGNLSSKTKNVAYDLKTLTDKEFFYKYQVSKTKYQQRVDKYGDPAVNAPLAKIGRKLNAEANKVQTLRSQNAEKKAEKKQLTKMNYDEVKDKTKKMLETARTAKSTIAVRDFIIETIRVYDEYQVNKLMQEVFYEAFPKLKGHTTSIGL